MRNFIKKIICSKPKSTSIKEKKIKILFSIFFDGVYDIEPFENTSNTYSMGVCKLEYNEKRNVLTVHLRRPGLLIGKGGNTIDRLEKYIGCKVSIVEVDIFK